MKIGIDVGGTHIGLGLIDEKCKLILKEEKDYDVKQKDMSNIICDTIINGVNKILKESKLNINEIQSIGIAFPGTVTDKIVIKAENLGVFNLNIVDILKKHFDVPIKLENDAKCAAIAEKSQGVLKKYNDAIFLIIGTGVGGAVFLGGKLLRPKRYSGFEVGHMVINKNGKKCNCGRNGCFEAYASMHTFKQKIRDEFNLQGADGKQIKNFIAENINDKKLNEIIEEYIENISIGITNLVNIFEPQIIVIGGGFGHYENILLHRLEQKIIDMEGLYNKGEDIPKIAIAKLKNDAGIIGAAMI
jgi:glucokinase